MRKAITLLGIAAMLGGADSPSVGNPNGQWRTQMHGARVEVRTCANQTPCAFLVWIDPAKARGVAMDLRNPDPALRQRPLVGVPIVWGLRPIATGWEKGRVYNPETGQTFRSAMQLSPDGKLKVTGCWGPLCRSEIWIRIDNTARPGA